MTNAAKMRAFVRGMMLCCQHDAGMASRYADYLQAIAVLVELPLWRKVAIHPGLSKDSKQALLIDLLHAEASESLQVLLNLLLYHDLLEMAAEIREVFLERMAEVNQEAVVHLELANLQLAENSQTIDAIRQVVQKAFDREHVHFRLETNAELIAGFRAKWGCRVLDASARGQLASMRHKLLYT